VVLDWNSWDFVGTGVVGYDGYLFVYTNTTLPCTDPNAWTVETIFDETEVVGADHLHVGAQHASQTFTYTLPCRYTGEAFIRLVAYDREGNTSFVETPAFYIGVNSVITSDLNELAGQVVHRLDPDQPHRVIPVQWWYTPDPCLVGDEPGRIEFDITFDGGYSWQCMHVLNDAENDWSPVTDGEEILAQGIHPQTGSQFMVDLDGNGTEETHYCTLDLVIPDYYCDRYPYEYQVSIRLYWRQHGVGTCCEDIERLIIEQSPDFSIADELGPTIVMDDCPVAGTILPGQKLDITWQAKELNPVDYPGFRSWFPIGDSCDGNLIINTDGYGLPVVQAWFSTDAFDNWATTSYDITLVDVATGEPYTVYNGLAGNATHYEWQIPIDFPQATYDLWITGHDDYGNSSYFTPNPQWAGDIQHELFLSAGSCQFDIGDLTAPEVTITSPMDGTHYDPGVVANITWTAEDDVAVTEQFVTIVGPSYSELFDAATSSFNWSIPDDAEVGTYTITVYAKDAAGHIGTDSITIIIDDIVDPWFTTDFTGTGTACLGGSEVYTWVTADNVGVTMQMLHVMGPGFDVEIALGAADTSYTWNLASDLQVGNYTATLMAYDAAGNMGQQSAVTVVSDCTNPTVTGMTASPSTIIPGGSVAFAWTSSDNLALVSQTLQVAGPGYDNTFALPADASSYSLSFPSTADLGSYTATLRAYDDAGNVGMATANFTIADNEAPVVAISTPSTGMTLDAGSMVNITWTATDNVGVANQWVTINGTNYNTAISSYAWAVPEEVGSYAIQVHAVDDAGHQGDSAQITVDVVEFPMITVAHKKSNPFRIQLFGSDFQPNCTVTINGSAVSYKFKNSGKLLLKNVKSLCPKGVAVTIQVHNPDLGYSNEFEFMR